MIDLFQNPHASNNLFINSALDSAHILKYANSLPTGNTETSWIWYLFRMGWCEEYQHVIQLLVAIGTVGSVIVSLWLALRPKKSDVRGTMDIGVILGDNVIVSARDEDLDYKKFLYITVYNHSDWDVQLKNYSFSIELFFCNRYLITIFANSFRKSQHDSSLNITSKSYCTFMYNLNCQKFSLANLVNYIDLILQDNKPLNKFIILCLSTPFISFKCITISAINEEFKLDLSKELIKLVKNRILSHQKILPKS